MVSIKDRMKEDVNKMLSARCSLKKALPKKKTATKNLELYSVTATLYGEARDLDSKGITRVAETIRNRQKYYAQNKAEEVKRITYRQIVSAPNQYVGFDPYKNKSLKDFQEFEKNLSAEEKKKWNRCMNVARKVVGGKLKTNYAKGALGFNRASVEANKKIFKTTNVFKDDSYYADNPKKQSPHVFFGDYHLLPLKDKKGKLLAKGGNPKEDETLKLLAQNKRVQARSDRG